jgi:hypothetical protein
MVEEWFEGEKKRMLNGYEKEMLEDLREEAKFSLYCQTGGGQCMSGFGKKVASYALALGVKADVLFRKLIDEAVEALNEGDFDF